MSYRIHPLQVDFQYLIQFFEWIKIYLLFDILNTKQDPLVVAWPHCLARCRSLSVPARPFPAMCSCRPLAGPSARVLGCAPTATAGVLFASILLAPPEGWSLPSSARRCWSAPRCHPSCRAHPRCRLAAVPATVPLLSGCLAVVPLSRCRLHPVLVLVVVAPSPFRAQSLLLSWGRRPSSVAPCCFCSVPLLSRWS